MIYEEILTPFVSEEPAEGGDAPAPEEAEAEETETE